MARQEDWDDFDGEIIRRGKKNREKVRQPKAGNFWCRGCDAQLIYAGQRCPNCGQQDIRRKNKR